jgi:hypothetical protein
LRINNRPCHLGLTKEIGIPFSQQLIFLEVMKRLQGTSSIFEFLNHFSPVDGSPMASLTNSSVTSNWVSPIFALHPSKVCAKSFYLKVMAFKYFKEGIPALTF